MLESFPSWSFPDKRFRFPKSFGQEPCWAKSKSDSSPLVHSDRDLFACFGSLSAASPHLPASVVASLAVVSRGFIVPSKRRRRPVLGAAKTKRKSTKRKHYNHPNLFHTGKCVSFLSNGYCWYCNVPRSVAWTPTALPRVVCVYQMASGGNLAGNVVSSQRQRCYLTFFGGNHFRFARGTWVMMPYKARWTNRSTSFVSSGVPFYF